MGNGRDDECWAGESDLVGSAALTLQKNCNDVNNDRLTYLLMFDPSNSCVILEREIPRGHKLTVEVDLHFSVQGPQSNRALLRLVFAPSIRMGCSFGMVKGYWILMESHLRIISALPTNRTPAGLVSSLVYLLSKERCNHGYQNSPEPSIYWHRGRK